MSQYDLPTEQELIALEQASRGLENPDLPSFQRMILIIYAQKEEIERLKDEIDAHNEICPVA